MTTITRHWWQIPRPDGKERGRAIQAAAALSDQTDLGLARVPETGPVDDARY